MFQFDRYIKGYYHYEKIWAPRIDEVLRCLHERENNFDEFAITIIKEGLIVGHVPRQISQQFYNILKNEGYIKVKVIGNPSKTKKYGIHVPCLHVINGQKTFI